MTLAELREKIEGMPPGSMLPRDWLLDELGKATGAPSSVDNWVDITRAAEITGESIETLRARAVRWRGQREPKIRVTKNNPEKERSPWLFAEEDCWAYARTVRPGVSSAGDEPGGDPNDVAEIGRRLVERATANL